MLVAVAGEPEKRSAGPHGTDGLNRFARHRNPDPDIPGGGLA